MSFREYLKYGVFGNRITAVGSAVTAGGIATMINGLYCVSEDLIYGGLCEIMVGGIALLVTGFGIDTFQNYKKARKLIQKGDNLDGFFGSDKKEYYCPRQGVYLAARDAGVKDLFWKKYNLIPPQTPNF